MVFPSLSPYYIFWATTSMAPLLALDYILGVAIPKYDEWMYFRDVNEINPMYEEQPNLRDANKFSEC